MTTPCNTNPTSGCADNGDAVQLKITTNKLTVKLNDLDIAVDGLALALANCCSSTGINLNLILDRLKTILENNTECCDGINVKLVTIWNKLKDIADHVVICDENTTTATDAPEVPTTTSDETGTTSSSTETPQEGTTSSSSTEEPITTSSSTENECFNCYLYDLSCLGGEATSTNFTVVDCETGNIGVITVYAGSPWLDYCYRIDPVYLSGEESYTVNKKTVCGEYCVTTTTEEPITTTSSEPETVTTTTGLFVEMTVKLGTSVLGACSAGNTTVYTSGGCSLAPGCFLFLNSELTTPVLAFTYVLDTGGGSVYHLNASTGEVGTTEDTC